MLKSFVIFTLITILVGILCSFFHQEQLLTHFPKNIMVTKNKLIEISQNTFPIQQYLIKYNDTEYNKLHITNFSDNGTHYGLSQVMNSFKQGSSKLNSNNKKKQHWIIEYNSTLWKMPTIMNNYLKNIKEQHLKMGDAEKLQNIQNSPQINIQLSGGSDGILQGSDDPNINKIWQQLNLFKSKNNNNVKEYTTVFRIHIPQFIQNISNNERLMKQLQAIGCKDIEVNNKSGNKKIMQCNLIYAVEHISSSGPPMQISQQQLRKQIVPEFKQPDNTGFQFHNVFEGSGEYHHIESSGFESMGFGNENKDIYEQNGHYQIIEIEKSDQNNIDTRDNNQTKLLKQNQKSQQSKILLEDEKIEVVVVEQKKQLSETVIQDLNKMAEDQTKQKLEKSHQNSEDIGENPQNQQLQIVPQDSDIFIQNQKNALPQFIQNIIGNTDSQQLEIIQQNSQNINKNKNQQDSSISPNQIGKQLNPQQNIQPKSSLQTSSYEAIHILSQQIKQPNTKQQQKQIISESNSQQL